MGLALSFRAWPVSCQEAEPYHLGARDRCLWVAWTADSYRADGDLERAQQRVAALGADGADAVCRLAAGLCPTCRVGQREAGMSLAPALGLSCPADVAP